jgi:hypothetical protein
LDDYIAKFERQARVAEYDLDNALTIDLFIKGLPRDLVEKALQLDEPRTYNEWKDAVSRRQQQYFFIKTRLDSFKKPTQNTPRPGAWVPRGQWNPRGGWRGNNRPRDPNAMDTSADRTRGRLANAEEVLEEDARRRRSLGRRRPTKRTTATIQTKRRFPPTRKQTRPQGSYVLYLSAQGSPQQRLPTAHVESTTLRRGSLS